MLRRKYITGLVSFLLLLTLLSGCTSSSTPQAAQAQPTIPVEDPNIVGTSLAQTVSAQQANVSIIRTEAAKTVVAQITNEAVKKTTITATKIQATAISAVITQTPVITNPPPVTQPEALENEPTQKPLPAETPALACKIISMNPREGYKIAANGNFDVTWTVENVGTSVWKIDSFRYQYWKGEQYAKIPMYKLQREVWPGSRINLTVDFIAPDVIGMHTTWWKLADENGKAFCTFRYTVVIDSPTYTVTPTPWY